MAITIRTALIIQGQGDNIVCEPCGQGENGKWAIAINLYKEGRIHTTLASTDPVFDNKEEGVECIQAVVTDVRKRDFSQQSDAIAQELGVETTAIVAKVIEAAG